MKKNKIAVIGGTGKAGQYLVKELAAQNFQVKLLIRNPEKAPSQNPSAEIITGNANSFEDVQSLLEGCDAVISTLGLGMPNSEKNIFSTSTVHVLQAMEKLQIERYIVITGLNVDTPWDKKSQKTQTGTDWMKMNFPETTADKQKEFEILSESSANWTLVRLPLIELTNERNETAVSLTDCLGDKISAADLAFFLTEQLSSDEYSRKPPFISNL